MENDTIKSVKDMLEKVRTLAHVLWLAIALIGIGMVFGDGQLYMQIAH